MKCINRKNISDAIEYLGISGSDVCIHASIKSFHGKLECGIEGITDELLLHDCTIMVPTFSDAFEGKPIPGYMPKQNGAGDYSYFLNREYKNEEAFSVNSKEITVEEMGVFPKYILEQKDSVRGNHALNSFTALGENAARLVQNQTNQDVYSPLERLCAHNGYVLLMGTGLESATIIHYAEQVSGRTPLIRWSYDESKRTIPVFAGSCSAGFSKLAPFLSGIAHKIQVGESTWTCYNAKQMMDVCSKEIRSNPRITHCKDILCERCKDMVLGGPIIEKDFWDKVI